MYRHPVDMNRRVQSILRKQFGSTAPWLAFGSELKGYAAVIPGADTDTIQYRREKIAANSKALDYLLPLIPITN